MSIILHILRRNIDFSGGGVLILRKEDQTSRNAHCIPSTGMVQLFKEYFIFCLDTALPQRNIYYSHSEGYVCFEYCICCQVWGCCNYVEDI